MAGTVTDREEASNWLAYTYYYVRMLKSPTLYSVPLAELEADPLLEQRRMDLVHTAATILDKCNLIKVRPLRPRAVRSPRRRQPRSPRAMPLSHGLPRGACRTSTTKSRAASK